LSSARQGQEVERLTEQLKDKDEAIVRLQIEVQSLQVSHFNGVVKTGLNKVSCIMPVSCMCNLKQLCFKGGKYYCWVGLVRKVANCRLYNWISVPAGTSVFPLCHLI
jgi:hypothetical protein